MTSSESLDVRIGSRWFLYAGVIAIILGVSYFEKLAIDNHWLSEAARIVQGTVVGLLFAGGGNLIAHRGRRLYGQVMSGAGVAILYLSTYAAFNRYHLISEPTAFVVLVVTTIWTAWMSDKQDSKSLALAAVCGGFATPFLLDQICRAEVPLFTYDLVLVAGTLFLSHRRAWPSLNIISYLGSLWTIVAWSSNFSPDRYLTTESFLTAFCAMFIYIRRRSRGKAGAMRSAEQNLLATAPVFYYFASLSILFEHSTAFLIYTALLCLTGTFIASRKGAGARAISWCAAAMPLLVWSAANSGYRTLLVPGLTVWAGTYLMNLIGLARASFDGQSGEEPIDLALLHLNSLVTYAGAYLLLASKGDTATAAVAAGFACFHGGLARLRWNTNRNEALHLTAVAFTLWTIAIALALKGPWVTTAWAVEGAALTWLALIERREWLRSAGATLLTVAIYQLFNLELQFPYGSHTVLLNGHAGCGMAIVFLCYLLAWLHRRRRLDASANEADGVFEPAFWIAAQFVTLMVLTSEIADFYWFRMIHTTGAAARDAAFTREMAISITWASYAAALTVAGLRRDYAPIRYFAIVVFVVAVGKVAFVDLSLLDQVYRVASVIGLGVMLLASSYLYQGLRSRQQLAAPSESHPA